MSGQVYDQYKQSLFLDAIDNPILVSKLGRTVTFPFAAQWLVVETPNEPESGWTRDLNDVFPLLVPFEYIFRRLPNSALNVAMLEDLPHILNRIYS